MKKAARFYKIPIQYVTIKRIASLRADLHTAIATENAGLTQDTDRNKIKKLSEKNIRKRKGITGTTKKHRSTKRA